MIRNIPFVKNSGMLSIRVIHQLKVEEVLGLWENIFFYSVQVRIEFNTPSAAVLLIRL